MSTDAKRYQQEPLLALRLRDIPGPRIAEALAEVDSHIAETPLPEAGPDATLRELPLLVAGDPLPVGLSG